MANNKIIYFDQVLIDLTGDTVSPETLAEGITAHDMSGEIITGTSTKDSDTSDATAAVAEILTGKTAYARGAKLTGTMPDQSGTNGEISGITDADSFSIPQGYHDGSGKVAINHTDKAKIIPGNIKQGVQILGVTGTLEPSSSVTAQSKAVTPAKTAQTVLPDAGVDYLSQVTVEAVPYATAANAAGGTTVTIG